MKRLTFILLFFVTSMGAQAGSLSELFEATQVVEKKPVVKKKKVKKVVKRKVASEPKIVTTFVYSSKHSFNEQVSKEVNRKPASLRLKGRVIAVRRELALSSRQDGNIPQEFVINTGSRLGIEKGSKLKVYRTLPIVDPYDSNKQHEIKVDFAVLKVTHVEDSISLAVLEKIESAKNTPYVGTRGVLVGDYVSNF